MTTQMAVGRTTQMAQRHLGQNIDHLTNSEF